MEFESSSSGEEKLGRGFSAMQRHTGLKVGIKVEKISYMIIHVLHQLSEAIALVSVH